MKQVIILSCLLSLLAFKALGQRGNDISLTKSGIIEEPPAFATGEIISHIGTEVYIRDTIAGYKIINKHLKLLYLGNNYPNQLVTIVIKGRKANRKLKLYQAGVGHFSGKAVMYQGKPAIIVTDPYQTGTRVQI